MSSKTLSAQTTWLLAGRMMSFLLSFFVPVLLVRVFSKNDFGLYREVLLFYVFFEHMLQFGFRHSLFYFIPQNEEDKSRYVINTLIVMALLGVFLLGIFTVFNGSLSQLFNAPELSSLLPLTGLYILFMLVASPFETLLVIETKAKSASYVMFLTQLSRAIFVIMFVLIFKTVLSAVFGLVAYSFIRCIAYLIFLGKNFSFEIEKQNIELFKKQLAYATPMGFSGILGGFAKRIDKFLLTIFLNPASFAIYSVGNYQVPFINMLFTSTGEVTLPRMVSYFKNNEVDNFLLLWRKFLVRMSFFGIGSFFLMQTVGYDFITLIYTNEYSDSVVIFRIILLLIFANMLGYGLILRSMAFTKDIFISNLLAFIVGVPASYFGIKLFGQIGAAFAAILIFYTNAFSQLAFSSKRLKISFPKLFPLKEMSYFIVIAGGIFLLIFNLQDLIPFKTLRLIVSVCLFLPLYILICYKTKIFNVFQEEIFIKMLSKIGIKRK